MWLILAMVSIVCALRRYSLLRLSKRKILPLVNVLLNSKAQGQAMIITAVTLFHIFCGSLKYQCTAAIVATDNTTQVKYLLSRCTKEARPLFFSCFKSSRFHSLVR